LLTIATLPHRGKGSVEMRGDWPLLVFDIGGTSLRAATYDVRRRQIGALVVLPTPSLLTVPESSAALAEIVDAMKRAACKLNVAADPHAICVGFPGPVDRAGNVYAAPTIWGRQYLDVLPLKSLIADCWPRANIEIVNDVTAAGYYFVDDHTRDFLVITVGSGIGSKVFIDGEPILGPNARGGEIGHLRVDFSADALTCDCGGIGHLGAVASGRGVLRSAIRRANDDPKAFRLSQAHASCKGQPGELTNEMLVDAFMAGDAWTRATVTACTAHLGRALAAVHLNLGIEKYVVTGGFAEALGDAYRTILADAATGAMWRNGLAWFDCIQVCRPDEHPGLNGAGRLLQRKYGQSQ
jgi:glucokinase